MPRVRKSASGSPQEGIRVVAASASCYLGDECRIKGDTSRAQGEVVAERGVL